MIKFKENDFYLSDIKREAKIATLAVQKSYRIFGLKNDNNPPLLLRINRQNIPEDRVALLVRVFKNSGLEVHCYRDYDKGIAIGIRRDVREDVPYTSALIQTIIYYLEGRIDLPKDFVLPSKNKFKTNGTPLPPEGSQQNAPDDMDALYDYYFRGR